MSLLKNTLCLIVFGGLSACSVSSQQNAEQVHIDVGHTHSSKSESFTATVKPGASITINSTLPSFMSSGTFQKVQLSFEEAYNDGNMSVRVEPSEGLSLYGGVTSKTFDMTASGEHVWDLDVKADTDGVYFLNVFAEAKGQGRSFSVRLNMGTVTQKMFDDAMPADGKLMDGGKIRVLEAEETIK